MFQINSQSHCKHTVHMFQTKFTITLPAPSPHVPKKFKVKLQTTNDKLHTRFMATLQAHCRDVRKKSYKHADMKPMTHSDNMCSHTHLRFPALPQSAQAPLTCCCRCLRSSLLHYAAQKSALQAPHDVLCEHCNCEVHVDHVDSIVNFIVQALSVHSCEAPCCSLPSCAHRQGCYNYATASTTCCVVLLCATTIVV
jgi:hypothetical protein